MSESAIAAARAACEAEPARADLKVALGRSLLADGRLEQAAAAFLAAVRVDRSCAPAHEGLGAIFDARGDEPAALAAYEEAARWAPDRAPLLSRIGQILVSYDVGRAAAYLERACTLDAADATAARHLAYALRRLNRTPESRAVAARLRERDPADLQAALAERLSLSPVPASAAQLEREREDFAEGLARLHAESDRLGTDAESFLGLHWENFVLAYQGGDDRELQRSYAALLERVGRRLAPWAFAHRPRRAIAAGERVRVGFVSGFIHDCTVGKYFRSWMEGLDPRRFEVSAYATGPVQDALAAQVASAVSRFRRVRGPASLAARAILADAPDVLVYPEVGMETTTNLLATLRLAPVQCAGWGHPVTTGRREIDWFLGCADMEPANGQDHYTERLFGLPGLGTRYRRPEGGRGKAPSWPAATTRFFCPQPAFKVHPSHDAVLARIAARLPTARFVFIRDYDEALTEALRRRLAGRFAEAGLDFGERAEFLPRLAHDDFLATAAACDAMLDTMHWSGGNTALDALAAGLPIVTLPGSFMRGRQCGAMLGMIGLGELVARDVEGYVALACRLATDRPWRDAIAARIRGAAAGLFDDARPLEALGNFLDDVARGREPGRSP